MLNFEYHNSTHLYFGQGQIAALAKAIPAGARVLFAYGGGSIKHNGVYQQVCDALANHHVVEFAGIEPNPSYETAMRAVALIKQQQLDFVLAVGGGSVVDGCKFIAAAALFDGEPWDILAKQAPVKAALPLGVVLTLPATGSESNPFAVVSKLSEQHKLAFASHHVQPQFAVLDPATSLSLPTRQVANGIVDAFVHVVEQYLTQDVNTPLQDRFAEGILLTLIEQGPLAFSTPDDVDVRANIMWSATMALNGLIGKGVVQDWSTHGIGHQLTALFGLDHAQTLAIVMPRLLWQTRSYKRAKLLQFASRVWGINEGDDDSRIREALARTEQFFHSVRMPTRLADYQLDDAVIEPVVSKLAELGMTKLGETGAIDLAMVRTILKDSL